MPNTISQFAQQFRGGVRPNLFRVQITGKPGPVGESFEFHCKGASIPASTIGSIDVPYMGRQLKVPGDRTFEEWTVTVLNDVNWAHRSNFERWSDNITANAGNFSRLRGESVYGTGIVLHLDRSGNTIRRYTLQDIFPTSIGAIDLTMDGNDTVEEYTVGFAVNGVQSMATGGFDATAGGLGLDVQVSANAQVGPVNLGLNT